MTAAMGEQDIHNAPIVQLLLTVSFDPVLANLSIIDLVEVERLFHEGYPVFRQINRAGPMSFVPASDTPTINQLVGLPRVAFVAADAGHQVLFQNDRLSYGWTRLASLNDAPDYPGFASILTTFLQHLATLFEWIRGRGETIEPSVGEIVYSDAFPLQQSGSEKVRSTADIFSFMNPSTLFRMHQFDFSWSEPISNGLQGYIEGTATGPALSPEGAPVLTLETTAAFNANVAWEQLREPFETAHDAIQAVYERVVMPNARVTL